MNSLFDDLKHGLEEAIEYEKKKCISHAETYTTELAKELSCEEIGDKSDNRQ